MEEKELKIIVRAVLVTVWILVAVDVAELVLRLIGVI